MAKGSFDPRPQKGPQIRINHRIRANEVRVIGGDGAMLGVLPLHQAISIAQEQELDLVEVNPKAEPPVCKIMDFGKYKYEEKKKQRDAKKKQSQVEIKEIKLRPKTDDHDLEWKIRDMKRFLGEGDKVKITVRFRGREITHPERAQMVIDRILKELEGLIVIEMSSRLEGKTMGILLAPKGPGAKPATPLKPSKPPEPVPVSAAPSAPEPDR
ncbi:MAG: translation initiation factor IF-3 [Deltaproteobacteria bacterium]|nr:translation initiation factor IF-3 [Deltaproteobacteria bacterium]